MIAGAVELEVLILKMLRKENVDDFSQHENKRKTGITMRKSRVYFMFFVYLCTPSTTKVKH